MNKKYKLKWKAKRKENNMNKKYELTDETQEIGVLHFTASVL